MKTVAQVSRITGVSIRTLRHYDAIGLLKPAKVTDAGYRLYDDASLMRLQTILLFRQLRFPLKEIKRILDDPQFDSNGALEQQIHMLELQREHLDGLIAHARHIQKTGGISMSFKAFDTSKLDDYAAQAKAKWGSTDAYREYEEKCAGQSQDTIRSASEGLMDIFREFGRIRDLAPESAEAQVLVKKLQNHITEHFYTCTPQILKGLGQMYAAPGEMQDNIDRAGGERTADFVSRAIAHYTK